ncbi:MAG: hypothetical protein IPJ95_07645 [Gemmatimonadetes bacterium]|nr:hypothetical protein [Gemmatimonadota bacterium]
MPPDPRGLQTHVHLSQDPARRYLRRRAGQLAQLVSRLDTQRAGLEQLVRSADRSIGQLRRLSTLGERVKHHRAAAGGVEELAGRFGAAERLATLVDTRNQLESDLADIGRGIERTRGEGRGGADRWRAHHGARDDLAGFRRSRALPPARGEMDTLSSRAGLPRRAGPAAQAARAGQLAQYKAASGRIGSFDGD